MVEEFRGFSAMEHNGAELAGKEEVWRALKQTSGSYCTFYQCLTVIAAGFVEQEAAGSASFRGAAAARARLLIPS